MNQNKLGHCLILRAYVSLTDTPLKPMRESEGKIVRPSNPDVRITKRLFTLITLISLPQKVHQSPTFRN